MDGSKSENKVMVSYVTPNWYFPSDARNTFVLRVYPLSNNTALICEEAKQYPIK